MEYVKALCHLVKILTKCPKIHSYLRGVFAVSGMEYIYKVWFLLSEAGKYL